MGRWGKCCTSCISLSWSKVSDRHNQTHPSKHSLVLVVYESTVTFGSFSAGYDGRTYFVFARLRSPLLHCVLAVTLASFSPHDSSGFSLFCYLLPCFPLSTPSFSISLTFQCNSCCSVKKKEATADWRWDREQAFSFLQKHLFLSSVQKNVNMSSYNIQTWDTTTGRRIWSSEWRSAKQQPLLNPCGPCCNQWQGFPPASLSSIRGAKCVTRRGP